MSHKTCRECGQRVNRKGRHFKAMVREDMTVHYLHYQPCFKEWAGKNEAAIIFYEGGESNANRILSEKG